MDDEEIRSSAALEERHWWYAGRRALVRRLMRGVPGGRAARRRPGLRRQRRGAARPGLAGHRRRAHRGRRPARARRAAWPSSAATRAGCRSPTQSVDLVMSTDVWEHVEDDEPWRARPSGCCGRAAGCWSPCPPGMELWSGHDVALGHVRRYERAELVDLVESARASWSHDVASWNVLLRPVAGLRRTPRTPSESEMEHVDRAAQRRPARRRRARVAAAGAALPRHQPRAPGPAP